MMQVFPVLCACLILITCSQPDKIRVLTRHDNGKRITCRIHQEFKIRLAANPTTGFSWQVSGEDTQLVELLRSELVPIENRLMGAPSEQVFSFRPRHKGSAPLRLHYRRPWEKGVAPAESFSVTLVIR